MSEILLIILLIIALAFIIILFLTITKKITFPFLYCVPEGSYLSIGMITTNDPLSIEKEKIKHLNQFHYTFTPPSKFMADPFIVKDKEWYYIFFEQINYKVFSKGADIALFRSNDLLKWEYKGVVLREPFHISYPNVFQWKDNWYMIPESAIINEVRLYESNRFPFKWNLKAKLISDSIADPTLIIKDDTFFILGQTVKNRKLRIFFSDDLFSGWAEHPSSPIRAGDNETQPAGKSGIINDKLIYFVQDHSLGYGTGVIAYEILSLSKSQFKDVRLQQNPILYRHGNDWAQKGMHHISWITTDKKKYFCVVDGTGPLHKKHWSFSFKNLPVFTDHL